MTGWRTYLTIITFVIVAASTVLLLYHTAVSTHVTIPAYTFSLSRPAHESLMIYSALYGNESSILEIARAIGTSPILLDYVLRMFTFRVWAERNLTRAAQLVSYILNRTSKNITISSTLIDTALTYLRKANFSINMLNLTYFYYVSALLSRYARQIGNMLVRNYVITRLGQLRSLESVLRELENKTELAYRELGLVPTEITINTSHRVLVGSILNVSGRAYEILHGVRIPLAHATVRIMFGSMIVTTRTGDDGMYRIRIRVPISDTYVGRVPLVAILLPNSTLRTAGSTNFTIVNVLPLSTSLTLTVRGVLCSHGVLYVRAHVRANISNIDYSGLLLLKIGSIRHVVDVSSGGTAYVQLVLPYGRTGTDILCAQYRPDHKYLTTTQTCLDLTTLAREDVRYLIRMSMPNIVLYPVQRSIMVKVEVLPAERSCSLSSVRFVRLIVHYGGRGTSRLVEAGTVTIINAPVSMSLLNFAQEVTVNVTAYPLQPCSLPTAVTATVLVINLYTLLVGAIAATAFIAVTGAAYARLRRRERASASETLTEVATASRELEDSIEKESNLVSLMLRLCNIFRIRVEMSDTVRQIALKLMRVVSPAKDLLTWLVRTYEAVRYGEKLHLTDVLMRGLAAFKDLIKRILRR